MEIFYKEYDTNLRCTNVSYNCLDRHISSMSNKHETALLWDGNFWDEDIHDYADITWETVDVLTNKIANVFKQYCKIGDNVLLYLHNVMQLPISILAASRIGVVSVLLVRGIPASRLLIFLGDASNPATATLSELTAILKMSHPKLVVTVDGFWQAHELFETKKQLDKAIEDAQTSSIGRVLVIRHNGPNPGIPPPERVYPGRRPCYLLKQHDVPKKECDLPI
ncbi:hypothetical protein DICVIV_09568 [Dictyocaulus viviparus]|uniref:acetate--CoA ligase n=1 Tax=Dictyocaulus viviparus TaxID=29172 RepID=A0A0D8XKW7_DICVI|nr:hypothetical protein DICVIV_09568 [Dictyocaulus viviparus]